MQDQIFAKAVEAGGRLTVKSALNPILWLCAIITIPTFCAVLFQPNFPHFLVVIGCSPVVAALFGFMFLLIFDRDKLQSEDYQIKKRTLELTQQKGDAIPIEVNPELVIENPDISSFESGEN